MLVMFLYTDTDKDKVKEKRWKMEKLSNHSLGTITLKLRKQIIIFPTETEFTLEAAMLWEAVMMNSDSSLHAGRLLCFQLNTNFLYTETSGSN